MNKYSRQYYNAIPRNSIGMNYSGYEYFEHSNGESPSGGTKPPAPLPPSSNSHPPSSGTSWGTIVVKPNQPHYTNLLVTSPPMANTNTGNNSNNGNSGNNSNNGNSGNSSNTSMWLFFLILLMVLLLFV